MSLLPVHLCVEGALNHSVRVGLVDVSRMVSGQISTP